MFRLICVALLLAVLLDTLNQSTASHKKLHVSKVHIRKCGCRVFAVGRIWCPFRLFHAKRVKIQDLVVKCFCNKTKQHKFPEFQAACNRHRLFPTTPF